jgi:hypothetical protein
MLWHGRPRPQCRRAPVHARAHAQHSSPRCTARALVPPCGCLPPGHEAGARARVYVHPISHMQKDLKQFHLNWVLEPNWAPVNQFAKFACPSGPFTLRVPSPSTPLTPSPFEHMHAPPAPQASLSAVPLAMIQALTAGRPDHDVWLRWGQEILTTGVFAIIICGTLGTLMVFVMAPILLNKEEVGGQSASRRCGLAGPGKRGLKTEIRGRPGTTGPGHKQDLRNLGAAAGPGVVPALSAASGCGGGRRQAGHGHAGGRPVPICPLLPVPCNVSSGPFASERHLPTHVTRVLLHYGRLALLQHLPPLPPVNDCPDRPAGPALGWPCFDHPCARYTLNKRPSSLPFISSSTSHAAAARTPTRAWICRLRRRSGAAAAWRASRRRHSRLQGAGHSRSRGAGRCLSWGEGRCLLWGAASMGRRGSAWTAAWG